MPKVKTPYIAAIAATFVLSGTALAQDTDWPVSPEAEVTYDHFTLADANADGALDRAEFEIYVGARADSGDEDYAYIRDAMDYDNQFTAKDVNADGLITQDEVPTASEPAMEESTDPMETEEDPLQN